MVLQPVKWIPVQRVQIQVKSAEPYANLRQGKANLR